MKLLFLLDGSESVPAAFRGDGAGKIVNFIANSIKKTFPVTWQVSITCTFGVLYNKLEFCDMSVRKCIS